MEKKIQDIRPLYTWIVDSVIAKARAHFLQDGVDEYGNPAVSCLYASPCSGVLNMVEGPLSHPRTNNYVAQVRARRLEIEMGAKAGGK
jgi:hypothetical protein